MNREQAEKRALELANKYIESIASSDPNEDYSQYEPDHNAYQLAYLQCFDDMQKDVEEWREAAQKVVMYHREKFHESTQLNKCERFNKAVCQLEKTLSK